MRELLRPGAERFKKTFELTHLQLLLVKDSFKNKVSRQRNFFRALAMPGNFRLVPQDISLDKLTPAVTGKRYRLYSAFLYAMLHSERGQRILDGKNPSLYDPDFSTWNSTVRSVLSDRESLTIFSEALERNQQAINPDAAPALRLIINRLNEGDRNLRIYDFGCGQNVDLPLLQTDKSSITDGFSPPEELKTYNKKVNMESGTGIDMMEPDLDWTRICTLQHFRHKEELAKADRRLDEVIRIKSETKNVRFINMRLENFVPSPGEEGDIVLTKWMRYQVPDIEKLKRTVLRTLKEGGYWISVGEEDKLRQRREGKPYNFDYDEIWVWQKQGNMLVPISSGIDSLKPVMVINHGKVHDFDRQFFTYSSR